MLNIYELEHEVEGLMCDAHIPGLALAVVGDGDVSYARGFGVTSMEDGALSVTPNTLFYVGSVAKPVTASAIMQLVERGVLDLDTPIVEYLPWFALSKPGAAGSITLRMLLTHTSGIATLYLPVGSRDLEGLERYVREEVPTFALVAPPGRVWSYSNAGYSVAGLIAQVTAGKSFPELVRKLVFEPLGMSRTTWDPAVAMTYPFAQGHESTDGELRMQHLAPDNTAAYPHGNLKSTVLDLAHFAILHLGGGAFRGERLLARETISEMHRIHARLYRPEMGGYGLGWDVRDYKGLRWVGHDGQITSYASFLAMIPDRGAAVVVMCNYSTDLGGRGRELVRRVLDELLALPKRTPTRGRVEPDRSRWPGYEGTYLGYSTGLVAVRIEGDGITLDLNGARIPLTVYGPDLYTGGDRENGGEVAVGFVPEGEGHTRFITVNLHPCERFEPDDFPESDRSELAEYVGTYRDQLSSVTFSLRESQLFGCWAESNREFHLRALDRSRFACPSGVFEFLSIDGDAVRSVRLQGARILMRQVHA